MRDLHLLRHAKAAAPDGTGTEGDRERPLSGRGRRDAEAMAARIARLAPPPDLVLCSAALRTRQTLERVIAALAPPPTLLLEDGLYLASAAQLLARLRQVPSAHRSVLLIGHNPGLHALALDLAAPPASAATDRLLARLAEGFPTAALASFRVAVPWSALERRGAALAGLLTPRDLEDGEA